MIYKFTNVNPLGKKEEDCVCRAITNAMNMDYYEIRHKLELIGELFNCDFLCVCCYQFLLDYVFGLKRDESWKWYTIADFANENDKGIFIIRVDGHLTCLIDGDLLDTWDCRNKIIDIIWEV